MQALLLSFSVTFLSEIGDKTQFLALILASRFKKIWLIILAIFCSSIINRIFASLIGTYLNINISQNALNFLLGSLFLLIGIFCLFGKQKQEQNLIFKNFGLFFATFLTFSLAEMGDKTQIATLALAAKFDSFFFVTIGSTFGALFADILAIFLGAKYLSQIPFKLMQNICASIFIILALISFLKLV